MTESFHNYSLNENSVVDEVNRLNTQYRYFQAVCGHSRGVRLPLDPSKVEIILDAATGTGSWTLDVAQNPMIASRLLSPTDSLQLLACDLSLEKLSPELMSHSVANPKIKVFEQDVTKPFPAALRGKVDIVHMSLLVAALTEKGWRKALQSISDVLKPGGRLVLLEYDLTFYTAASAPCATAEQLKEYAVTARRGSSVMDRMNALFSYALMCNNRVLGLSYRIPDLVDSSPLSVISGHLHRAPMGRLCKIQSGQDGVPLSEFEEFMCNNMIHVSGMLRREIVACGDIASDFCVPTEEEREKMCVEFAQFGKEHGMYCLASEWVAQKMV